MIRLSHPTRQVSGEITLDGSKSISNRLLIIRALSGADFPITQLSTSRDTRTLMQLIEQDDTLYDAGAAGTTFRFLTAYLAMKDGAQILTGSERMKQRPVGDLVQALNQLGADISFLEKEGYPPLEIRSPRKMGQRGRLKVQANVSSQFITALLLIAPYLPGGLELVLDGPVVSRSYIEMTLALMAQFGVPHRWEGQVIEVPEKAYTARTFEVEADWSAASYYYSLFAMGEGEMLRLNGLQPDSTQGDSVLARMMEGFGIQTEYEAGGVVLRKTGMAPKPLFEWDFVLCPDIAQTLAVTCAGLGVHGVFSGLETLSIKETDRIAALQAELLKTGVYFSKLPARFSRKNADKTFYLLEGKAHWEGIPEFAAYEDHRMAMSLAPLALLGPICIENPAVVEKSYPAFWEDLARLGFVIEHLG